MTKRALLAVAGFLGLCLSLSAQQTYRTDIFSSLNRADFRLALLTLSDAQPFSFSDAVAQPLLFSWLETPPPAAPDVSLPRLVVTGPRRAATVSAFPADDLSKEAVDVRRPCFDYAHGEVGVLYGSSSGKFGREFEQGYFIGEVGNDKMQISAGASYEHSTRRH